VEPDNPDRARRRQQILWELKEEGECNGLATSNFFLDAHDKKTEITTKAVCRSCEVQAKCLDYAITYEERWGIWGGYGERARRRLGRLLAADPTMTIEDVL
jgi:hypothetical protein